MQAIREFRFLAARYPIPGMAEPTPHSLLTVDEIRRQNLCLLAKELGSKRKLADRIGKSPSQVSQWINASPDSKTGNPRGISGEICRDIEAACGKARGWMDARHDTPATDPQPPKGGPPLGGTQVSVALAHQLSQVRLTMDPPTIEWGDSLPDQLPPRFILATPDDALAPDYPAGTRMSWSTAKAPRIGSVVLVRDRHNQAHVREYRQGRAPGQWIAAPTGRAFSTLDGADVTLLAVAEFEYRPLP